VKDYLSVTVTQEV